MSFLQEMVKELAANTKEAMKSESLLMEDCDANSKQKAEKSSKLDS